MILMSWTGRFSAESLKIRPSCQTLSHDSLIEIIYDGVDDGEKLGRGTMVMAKTMLDVMN
jgi:hypothetical protein